MAASNADGSPETPSSPLIPSISDDVAMNCFARVSRFDHPNLSLVSRSVRSILSSSELYVTRSFLGCSENFIYVSFRLPPGSSSRWFTLRRKTHLTQSTATNSNRTGYLLVPISSPPSPRTVGSAYVAMGSEIYVIGGCSSDASSSNVWVLDCRFHTWRQAPNMHVAREFGAAGVLDGKLYVIGGCVVDNWARSVNWAEVFDPKTQTWEAIPSPDVAVREKWMHASAVMEGKVYAMADRKGVVYEPKEGRWDVPEKRLDLGWRGRACVIENILFCYDYVGRVRGYDPKERVWTELKGMEGLPKFLCGATMANCGGKLVVLWEGKAGSGGVGKMEIWCAEIAVERRDEGEIWGTLVWSDVVLTVPNGSAIVSCLAVTL